MSLDDKIGNSGRRVIIDLTPTAAEEIDRLIKVTGLSQEDLFRKSMSVFRILINAYESGANVYYQKPGEVQKEIEKTY